MSLTEFVEVLGTLAVATNKTLTEEIVDVYFQDLHTVPASTLQAAVERLITSAKFFPSVGEIRAACDRVKGPGFQTFIVPALPMPGALDENDPRVWYACVTCQDTGWKSNWCPGAVNATVPPGVAALPADRQWDVRRCGSHACERFGTKGYGHEFVTRCPCYQSNAVIRKRLDARTQYAEKT